ncbi:MAG: ArnT family glycosyltransferase, partial [Microthrixaceae bacterium]
MDTATTQAVDGPQESPLVDRRRPRRSRRALSGDRGSGGTGPGGSATRSYSTRKVASIWLLAPVLVSLALVIVAFGRLDAPFSTRFDGFNTAVWATGARAVHSEGWIDARLGTVPTAGSDVPYAHHPPLTRIEVAVAEDLLGEHRWVDRLPAFLSSLAAVWICWLWLGELRFGDGARGLGVLAVGTTAYFARYSVMLNMEAVWLPFAFGLLWAWTRAERRGGGFWPAAVIATLGGLAAHQGILLAVGFAAWGAWRCVSQRRRPLPHEAGVMFGAVGSAVAFVGWILWATGGRTDIVESASTRSGGVSLAEFVQSQLTHGVS